MKKPVDQQLLDLVNGGFDGELDAAEQEELLKLLSESPEAREINADLESVGQLMDELPELEPPQYLQESIERQIRLPVSNGPRKWSVAGTWLSANGLRTGLALAAGVVLTVGVYEMGSEPITDKDATSLVGTVIKSQGPDQVDVLDRIQISDDTLNGQVELRRAGELFMLDVQLNSDGPAEVIVDFAGRGLEFEGITRTQDISDMVSVADGSIRVGSSGEQGYTLKLRRNSDTPVQGVAPLELEFYANNKLVHEAELVVFRQ